MNAIKNNRGDGKSSPKKHLIDHIYKFLTSIRFTIFLLSFIAIGSLFGTFIKQKASVEEYLSIYSENTYNIIRLLGLDDTYHSPWFFTLIILFAANLIICTLGRFIRFVRSERDVKLPDENTLTNMEMHFQIQGKDSVEAIKKLKKRYHSIHEEEKGIVLEKGALSRYGVLTIHASIIVILLGSFIGLIFGYKGFMMLKKGEVRDQITIRGDNIKERPLGFALRCKDFKASFYPGGEPKDYVSTVEVIENGNIVLEKDIRVNDPLNYKGIHVYQASYGSTPSFLFNIGGENVILRERDTYKKNDLILMVARFEGMIHDFGPGVLIAYLEKGEPKTLWFLKDVERLREKDIQGTHIRLEDIRDELYTGLEVSKDPGVWIVWIGFAFILVGLYMNFFIYHRKVFIRKASNGIIVAGVASKNREALKEEFERLKKHYGNQS
ncbi:MAG: cytochrome c biogenesis protein ResB [Proteobacteria bacterium]|nr:cytochrome c biogenesis protein ResB [Pseudomonadota bacterium]